VGIGVESGESPISIEGNVVRGEIAPLLVGIDPKPDDELPLPPIRICPGGLVVLGV